MRLKIISNDQSNEADVKNNQSLLTPDFIKVIEREYATQYLQNMMGMDATQANIN